MYKFGFKEMMTLFPVLLAPWRPDFALHYQAPMENR